MTISTTLSPETIISIIKEIGFNAKELGVNSSINKNAENNKAIKKLLIQAIIAGTLGLIFFALTWINVIPPLTTNIGRIIWLILGIITATVMIFSGHHIYSNAWSNLKSLNLNMNSLVSISTIAAWVYSMIIIIHPAIVPASALHVYFETAIFILAFIDVGHALETRARGKTADAIEKLIGLQSKTACIIKDGIETNIPIEDVKIGDLIKVKPGERIATDGIIIEGTSNIDESMLTGEPLPSQKTKDSQVIGGTINKTGSFIFRATKIGKDTVLAQIIELVKTAQNSKPPIARIADRVAGFFTPMTVIIAIITASIWFFFGPSPKVNYMLLTAMSVLVISCPCALGLATPISVIIGMGRAAQNGVLIRNADALEKINKITTLVFDKTGTITCGTPQIIDVICANDFAREKILNLAAALENNSEHPLASAFAQKSKKLLKVNDFAAIEGFGIKGTIAGKKILVGKKELLNQNNITTDLIKDVINAHIDLGHTIAYVSCDAKLAGAIVIADPIRSDSKKAIEKLHQLGFKTLMLSGDNKKAAKKIAEQVGIEQVIAEVLPADKNTQVRLLQDNGEIVGMVGDGINDAPALAAADVGFAIASGTDIAIHAADVTLMRSSLTNVIDAINISRISMRNIKQNIFGAFIYNIICIPIAAGVLYPFVGILLNPMLAAAAMALSDVTVISNANRLRMISC